MTGFGSSWKLSGGSMRSSAVTKVSKNPQVRRAARRRNWESGAETGLWTATFGERLVQRATAGETAHSARNGIGNAQEPRPTQPIKAAAPTARATAPAICL